jgi:hypothetical protein
VRVDALAEIGDVTDAIVKALPGLSSSDRAA